MSPENFVYWLQGYLEIGNPTEMTSIQIQEIKNHIGLVLNKVTPSFVGWDAADKVWKDKVSAVYLGQNYSFNEDDTVKVINFGPYASC